MEAFENYFKEADMDNDGKISVDEGFPFFARFGLPYQVFAQIWTYINHDKSGFLGRSEFFIALKLATVAQSGRALTPEIVKSALHGPEAAQIPAPQMKSVGSTCAPQVTPSPAMPQRMHVFFQENIKDICAKLQVAFADAAKYRFELNEEICKREKAEMELVSLIQKVEESQIALLKELDLSKSRLDLLQEENKKLQEDLDNAVEEVEESQIVLLKELDLSKSRLDLLQEENKKLQEERDNSVEEIEEVEESQIVLLKELNSSKSRLDLLQEENKELQEELDNAVEELEEVEESQIVLLKELDLSKSRIDLLQEENKKLQEERDNAVEEVEEVEDSQIVLLKELDSSKSRLDLLQEENKELQDELDNAVEELEEVEESQIVLLKELDLSKSRLDLLQEENKKLQEEQDNAVEEAEEVEESQIVLLKELNSSKNRLDLLQEENKELQEELDNAAEELEEVEESQIVLLKELDLSKSRLDLLQEENKKLQEERDNAVEEAEEVEESQIVLLKELDSSKNRLDLLQEENKELQEELDNAVEELEEVEESQIVLLKELDLSKSRLDLLQEENKKLQEERDNAVEEAEEVEESQIVLLKELDSSKNRLDLLQEENKELQEELDNAAEELEEVEESQIVLLKELDLSKSRLDLLQEENKKLQEERDNAVEEAEEVEESQIVLLKELDSSKNRLDLLQEENKELQEELDNAVEEVEEVEELQIALLKELDLSKSRLDLLQEENKKLQEPDNEVEEVEESQIVLLKELDLSKSRLDLLQEENKKLQEERDNAFKEVEELRAGAGPGSYEAFSNFSMLELQQATENFNNSHKIGEGGFGCVYKGFLRNTMVAIKMLHPEGLQDRPEFEQEIAILSSMRHPNLVTLIGICSEQSALVYEYLPNGSLEDRLACQVGTPPLTWQMRTCIIGEICRALMFLHSNKPNPIVHGNLNPANILLDANLVSKLSDFGISPLLIECTTNTLVHHTKNPKGTFAYMDPEFLRSGQITVKSDVYSFGIIVLRLLTGKPSINIIADVEDAVETDSLHSIIDKSAGQWPFVQAKQLTNLGLRCTQMHRRKRPNLESEWKIIESLMMAASLSVLPSFKSQLDDKGIPSYFMCPIFQEVMKDPHIAADGYTYEVEAIKGWLDGGHETSPMTNLPLDHLDRIPNRALRSAIQEWLQQHP